MQGFEAVEVDEGMEGQSMNQQERLHEEVPTFSNYSRVDLIEELLRLRSTLDVVKADRDKWKKKHETHNWRG